MYDYVFCIYDKGKNDKKVGYLHMNIYCNPINFGYRYQFNGTQKNGVTASREAADPSMIYFKGTYYIFPSMTAGFLHSKDMVNWDYLQRPICRSTTMHRMSAFVAIIFISAHPATTRVSTIAPPILFLILMRHLMEPFLSGIPISL